MSEAQAVEVAEVQKRVNYNIGEDAMQVRLGNEEMELPLPEGMEQYLAFMGLRGYLQQKTMGVEDKLAAIEEVYNELLEKGVSVFERKSPVGRTVQFKKADKIMALAMLKGSTVSAIQSALEGFDTDTQNQILNSDEVMNKLRAMQSEVSLA